MEAADTQVYAAIDQLLVEQDDHLMLPMTKLNIAIKGLFEENTRAITKIQDKLIRKVDRETTKQSDHLDVALTRVQNALETWQQETQYLLTQIAAKGGIVKAGDPLESALLTDLAQAPQLQLGTTLVLEVSRLGPYFVSLIEVLREIRDRMPGTPVRFAGEPAAEEDPEAVVEDDSDQGEDETPAAPRQMPVA